MHDSMEDQASVWATLIAASAAFELPAAYGPAGRRPGSATGSMSALGAWPRCDPKRPGHDPCRAAASSSCPGLRHHRPPSPRRQHSERSEEHTSELQSRPHLVCRLLLEKKKKKKKKRKKKTKKKRWKTK